MADLKISDMTYAAVDETFMIPAVNPSNLSTNYYVLAGMINFQRIFRWNSSAIYLADDLVIYNSSTVKGIFRVTTTTSAGDAPEGTGANKFRSVSLEFVPNIFTGTYSGGTVDFGNLGDVRTGRLVFPSGISLSGTSSSPDTFNFNAFLTLPNASFNNCVIRGSLSCPGQTYGISLRTFYGYNSYFFGTVEYWGTTSGGAIQNRYVDFEIHG